jgi:Fe-S-cluster containining protein
MAEGGGRSGPGRFDRALAELDRIRDSLRGEGNRERAGLFSCAGCVAWCCREGFNSMRATPLEAEAILRHLDASGGRGPALLRCRETASARRLDLPGGPAGPRTYTCPFLTAGNLCGVHGAKPLGCVTFTPVRDGGCDQDGERLEEAVGEAGALNDGVFGEGRWEALPLPLAVLSASSRGPRSSPGSRPAGSDRA